MSEEVELQKSPPAEEEIDVEDPGVSMDENEVRSRKERLTGSTHFGDTDFYEERPEEIEDATWSEVLHGCCVHTPREWGIIFIGILILCMFLYFFLLGLELLGTSAKVLGGCTAGSLFGDDLNPISGLIIGILATVLLQSSSTTTSIIVGLVGGGLDVKQAIYMVMGANIGTSVTNTIVALGQMGDGDQLERAFAGATVHDMFNFLSVLILLPVEAATGYLYHLTKAMLPAEVDDGEKWEGPIKKIVAPLGDKIIIANKDVIKEIANGDAEGCGDFYPVECEGGVVSAETCSQGLIGCDEDTNDCPAFFQDGATKKDDSVSGGVCLVLSLVILIVCLIGLVTLLQRMLMGVSTRIIYKATNINGYLAMIIGCGITILVQSSSITTSTLTPLVGMGVLQLEQMFPLTLGANIGTTFTALMAAMVSSKVESLQIALCHLFFNITGILIWYPVPFMRRVPLNGARRLGKATRIWRGFPVLYIILAFFVIPLIILGLSALFEEKSKGFTVLGSLLCVFIGLGIVYWLYWWRYKDGKAKCIACMSRRQRKYMTMKTLPDDMDFLKSEVERLKEHTGLPDLEEEKPGKDLDGAKQLESSEDSSEEVEEEEGHA